MRGASAEAELVVDPFAGSGDRVRASLSEGVRLSALEHGADHVVLWLRHTGDRDPTMAVERRLDVLGRDLADLPPAPDDLDVRAYREGADDAAIVDLLATAFAGTPDDGWDRDRLARRRAAPWYDPEDLLVATIDDRPVGVHWTKRRGAGTGEVHVLAVDPRVQRRGLGRALLRAGLHHLRERGCAEVLLWVDEGNASALALYLDEGFTRRWVDVAYALPV